MPKDVYRYLASNAKKSPSFVLTGSGLIPIMRKFVVMFYRQDMLGPPALTSEVPLDSRTLPDVKIVHGWSLRKACSGL